MVIKANVDNQVFGSLVSGAIVYWNSERYVVVTLLDFDNTLLRHCANGKLEKAFNPEIRYSPTEESTEHEPRRDLMDISDDDWAVANERFELIKPLVASGVMPTQDAIKAHAKVVSKPATTLYRWIRLYIASGTMSALFRQERSDKGKTKLTAEQEAIIGELIKTKYLNGQRLRASKLINEIDLRCKQAGIDKPHPNTIRNRLAALSAREVYEGRYGKTYARERLDLYRGSFDEATYPLKIVQMDHTDVDVIVVDTKNREPIGRPYITVALDIYSRMICGFYLSLDPPSILSDGMCIAHSMLPKEQYLIKLNIEIPWEIYGKPDCIYTDNGPDFRSNTVKLACKDIGVDYQYRPLERTNYGGHIEAQIKTLMLEIHSLPGTTFSNVQQRVEYDSEGKACMTLPELERWITLFIVGVYHQRKHSGLDTSPVAKYKEGIFGSKTTPGRGMIMRPINELSLRLNFLPMFKRTVQQYGILLDNITYYHEILQRWVDEKNPNDNESKFIVRRDPRDISVIYFYDPITREYHIIPYRDLSHPAVNIWEFEAARKFAIDKGAKMINEDVIFDAYEQMHEIVANAKKETKRARRSAERKSEHAKQPSVMKLMTATPAAPPSAPPLEQPQRRIIPFELDE